MKVCSVCHHKCSNKSAFCPFCGEKLTDAVHYSAYCHLCGTKNTDMLPTCQSCGASLSLDEDNGDLIFSENSGESTLVNESTPIPDEDEGNDSDASDIFADVVPNSAEALRSLFEDDTVTAAKGNITDTEYDPPVLFSNEIQNTLLMTDDTYDDDEDITAVGNDGPTVSGAPVAKAALRSLSSVQMLFAAILMTLTFLSFAVMAVTEMLDPTGIADSLANVINNDILGQYGLKLTFIFGQTEVMYLIFASLIPLAISAAALWRAYLCARDGQLKLAAVEFSVILNALILLAVYVATITLAVSILMTDADAAMSAATVFACATPVFVLYGIFYAKLLKLINVLRTTVRRGFVPDFPSVFIELMLMLSAAAAIIAAIFCGSVAAILGFVRLAAGYVAGAYCVAYARKSIINADEQIDGPIL